MVPTGLTFDEYVDLKIRRRIHIRSATRRQEEGHPGEGSVD